MQVMGTVSWSHLSTDAEAPAYSRRHPGLMASAKPRTSRKPPAAFYLVKPFRANIDELAFQIRPLTIKPGQYQKRAPQSGAPGSHE
jgi:hypothetical protein